MSVWKEFYQEYGKSVYRFLLSLTGSADEAEELLQETFYQAFLHVDRFEGRCSPYTWLCQIGKNAWLKECRRRKRFAEYDAAEIQLADAGRNPEAEVIYQDLRERTRRAVYHLKEPYKEVLILHVYGGLKYREIAQVFGKTESWAKVTCYRAKQQVAEEVKG